MTFIQKHDGQRAPNDLLDVYIDLDILINALVKWGMYKTVFFLLLKSVIRLSVGIQYLAARARSSADILNSPHQGETPPS